MAIFHNFPYYLLPFDYKIRYFKFYRKKLDLINSVGRVGESRVRLEPSLSKSRLESVRRLGESDHVC
jgi:hypothetical protein